MAAVAEGEKSPPRPGPDVDRDQVDLSWLTNGLRRRGLLRPPRPPTASADTTSTATTGEQSSLPFATEVDTEVDTDRVDFGWLTSALRRRGLLRQPPPTPGEQLVLFGPSVAPPRHRQIRWPTWRSDAAPGIDTDSLPATVTADPRARLLLFAAVFGWIVLYIHWTFRQHNGIGTP
ncbi:MAG: hypothetical protein H0T70_00695, partial [Acidimicrobiia bacterium]|nr:hypothetical protein [Acidimicrobiia bacterium]